MSLHHAELHGTLSLYHIESSMATAVYTYGPILLWFRYGYRVTCILERNVPYDKTTTLQYTMPVPKHPAVLQGSTLWRLSHRKVARSNRSLSSPTTVVLFILALVLVWWDEYCRRRRPCPCPFSSPDCRSTPWSRRGELVGHCVLVHLNSIWSP